MLKDPQALKAMIRDMAANVARGGSIEDALESTYYTGAIDCAGPTMRDPLENWPPRFDDDRGPTCDEHVGESLDPQGDCWSCLYASIAAQREQETASKCPKTLPR